MSFGVLTRLGIGALLCASSAAAAQAPSLGTAVDFAVLGGSTVTNTGASTVTGDLGVSPGTAVTGFPPGILTGTLHAGDSVALQAQSDLTATYDALAGATCNTVLTGMDLGGLTLTPGVYCFASSAPVNGVLTLDAQGDPNAVFIFQIGSTLLPAIASSVQVINGAQDANVFWQVGSSATLAAGVAFRGNIVALASITLGAGSSVSGRALARTGAVTMDTSNVSIPSSCPGQVEHYGTGVAGTFGIPSILLGCPAVGIDLVAQVDQGFPGAHGCLVIGLQGPASIPMASGGTLLVQPPMAVVVSHQLDGAGSFVRDFGPLPLGLLGLSLYAQAAYFDVTAVGGISFTDAVLGTVGM